jgi:hypothetical protein
MQLGMTRPVRHVYLTWSSEPHERVGDTRELTDVGHNEKGRLQLRPVGTLSKSTTWLLDKAERMCKRP